MVVVKFQVFVWIMMNNDDDEVVIKLYGALMCLYLVMMGKMEEALTT